MRTNLLWTNGFKQSFHVVIVGVNEWVGFGVVRMNVASLHIGDFVLVVTLSVRFLVFRFNSVKQISG